MPQTAALIVSDKLIAAAGPAWHAPGVAETVVVVDDDAAVRDAIVEVLELHDFAVLSARDGGEALPILRAAPRPCIALIDLVMPRFDGWQLAEAIFSDPRLEGIAIICCTAGRSDAPPGCAAILRKPFSLDAMVAVLRRIFDADGG
jgi:CheY-like chemotaxis protein